MPLQRCTRSGQQGYRWGAAGVCYVGTGAKAKAKRQGRAIEASKARRDAQNVRQQPTTRPNPLRADPTRTVSLRKAFVRQLTGRFKRLKAKIVQLIYHEDAFGLRPKNQPVLGLNVRWAFASDVAKIKLFTKWLSEELRDEVLEARAGDLEDVPDDAYWQKYVDEGYLKGAGAAFASIRPEALQGNPSFYEGTKQEFLRSAFGRPETISKVQGLAARVFTDLKGVTDAMSAQMTRVLADGLVQGKNPREIARDLNDRVDKIGITRAKTLAQTEIIRAHAEGQLDSFEALGVEAVGVMAEWSTAGDDHVCPQCAPLEGVVLSLKEARGQIPRHPNCRCTWIPAQVGEGEDEQKQQKKSKERIEKAIRKSLEAEVKPKPGEPLDDTKSTWIGADLEVDADRPQSILEGIIAALPQALDPGYDPKIDPEKDVEPEPLSAVEASRLALLSELESRGLNLTVDAKQELATLKARFTATGGEIKGGPPGGGLSAIPKIGKGKKLPKSAIQKLVEKTEILGGFEDIE